MAAWICTAISVQRIYMPMPVIFPVYRFLRFLSLRAQSLISEETALRVVFHRPTRRSRNRFDPNRCKCKYRAGQRITYHSRALEKRRRNPLGICEFRNGTGATFEACCKAVSGWGYSMIEREQMLSERWTMIKVISQEPRPNSPVARRLIAGECRPLRG